jgi:hypothetical protein
MCYVEPCLRYVALCWALCFVLLYVRVCTCACARARVCVTKYVCCATCGAIDTLARTQPHTQAHITHTPHTHTHARASTHSRVHTHVYTRPHPHAKCCDVRIVAKYVLRQVCYGTCDSKHTPSRTVRPTRSCTRDGRPTVRCTVVSRLERARRESDKLYIRSSTLIFFEVIAWRHGVAAA